MNEAKNLILKLLKKKWLKEYLSLNLSLFSMKLTGVIEFIKADEKFFSKWECWANQFFWQIKWKVYLIKRF